MKPRPALTVSDPERRLGQLNAYLARNFPEFFAEVRFQAGEDDYFLYARFGQYLARVIEHNRAGERTLRRGFTLLNQMARAATRHARIRELLLSGVLEYFVDAPKARRLARERLSATAQGYLASLCE
jgi:hypothetical protein